MPSKNAATLSRNTCEEVVQYLSQILADTYITYVKTQNFHWNIVDPRFYSLHKMLEEFYTQLAEANDELAERIRMLKQKAPGSMRQFLDLGTLQESDNGLSGDEMLQELCRDREALIQQLRSNIEHVVKLGDEGTGDLFIQHLRMHEKAAWILRSHLVDI